MFCLPVRRPGIAAAVGAFLAVAAPSTAAAAVLPSADLGAIATLRINGAPSDAFTGYRVTPAGDVNGDGRPDLLVSATAGGQQEAGRVYVVFGRTVHGVEDLELGDLGDRGFRILGPSASIQADVWPAGEGVDGAGDVNGDGLDDIVVGAPFSGPAPQGIPAGRAHVVFGKPTSEDVDLDALGGEGFTIAGRPDSFAGASVTGVGDFDADGFDDVAVGSLDDETHRFTGNVHVVWGSASPGDVDLASRRAPAMRIRGHQRRSRCGFAVERAGDVNGDGRPDFVLVCNEHGNLVNGAVESFHGVPTTAYVVFGRLGRTSGFSLASPGKRVMKVIGRRDLDDFYTAAGLGDVNGDGRDDFALGSPGSNGSFDDPSNAPGAVFVIFGRAGNTAVNFNTVARGAYRIDGELRGDQFGFALAGPGDVDGDGRTDLLVGSPKHDRGVRVGSGAAWLVPGQATTSPVQVAALPGASRADGNTFDAAGTSVAAVGDFDADGTPDLAIGAPGSQRSPGRVYIVSEAVLAGL